MKEENIVNYENPFSHINFVEAGPIKVKRGDGLIRGLGSTVFKIDKKGNLKIEEEYNIKQP